MEKFVNQFGQNVRRQRSVRGFSQEKLAEKADLNIRNVQRIEAGEINILITTARRIKSALGCSWDDLMGK
jgi:transcriptional regulator with XRE-family HTH domain